MRDFAGQDAPRTVWGGDAPATCRVTGGRGLFVDGAAGLGTEMLAAEIRAARAGGRGDLVELSR